MLLSQEQISLPEWVDHVLVLNARLNIIPNQDSVSQIMRLILH